MAKPPLSHYSPVFANKPWADEKGYTSYFSCSYSGKIEKSPKGRKQWGRMRGLYSWPVEKSLGNDLENYASTLYRKLISYKELTKDERFTWAQFILSQLVRTPTYMRYEKKSLGSL